MGCASNQYASLETYLIKKAKILSETGSTLFIVYENEPESKEFLRDLQAHGGHVYGIKHGNFPDLDFFREISRIIKKNQIDIVHSYFSPVCHYLNVYLTLMGLRKVVRTAPNLPLTINRQIKAKNFRIFYSLRHKALAIPFKKILCRSRGVLDEYKALGIPKKKLVITPGGVDIEKYKFSANARKEIRKEQNVHDQAIILGAVSRLVPIKRIDRLIAVFAGLRLPDQDLRLWIAGDGPERKRLEALVADLKLERCVRFLGHENDVSKLYSALDVFCCPSLAEGMSNSILEAMASELPILASDISSNRDLIDEGEGGYLVSFENTTEFQDRIERLVDEKNRKKMGAYDRAKAISQLSLESRIEKECRVYSEFEQ